MTARALLDQASARGVSLYRLGNRLRWRAPAPPPADLLEQLRAHKRDLLALIPERPLEGDPAFGDVDAYLVASRILGESVWFTADDATAERLERALAAEGDHRLVFTVAEVLALEGMLAADMQRLAEIKRWFRGARIDGVTRVESRPQ